MATVCIGESFLEETKEVSIEADVTERPRDDKSRPYLCTVCDKRFTRRGHLSCHKRIHTGEKPFVCTVCDKRFTQRGDLNVHKRICAAVKPFVCTVCNKRFAGRGRLNVHKRIHTGEKPFVCTVCDKRFTKKSILSSHKRLIKCCKRSPCNRSFSNESISRCTECGAYCRGSSELAVHERIHSREKLFICSVCGERCTTPLDVVVHSRTHREEKPYKCYVCGETFTWPQQLLSHGRVHTEETTSYKCSLCGATFGDSVILQQHEQHVHNSVLHADGNVKIRWETHENTAGTTVTMNMHEPAVRSLETGAATSVVSQDQVVAHSERIRPDPPLQGGHIVRPRASATSTVLPQTLASSTPTSGVTDKPFACTVCDKRFSARHGLVMVVLCNRADHYIFAL